MVSKLRVVDERSAFRSVTNRVRSYLIPLKCQLLSVGYSSQTWGNMMKNVLQRYFSILIAFYSVAVVAHGQSEKFIGKGSVQAIQFLPDGRWLAIGTTALLELYEAQAYQLSRIIEMSVDALEFSPDGSEMLVAAGNLLHQLDTTTGQVTETLTGGERRVSDLAYSLDGKLIAAIDVRGVIRLWVRHQKAFTFRRAHSRSGKYTILFSPDGGQLIVGAYDVGIWDIATAQLVGGALTDSRVTSLVLHPDETQFAIGTEEGQIELRVLGICGRTALIDGNDIEVEGVRERIEVDSLAFGPNGRTLIVGFHDSVIGVWDTVNQGWTRSWITKTRLDEEFKGWEGTDGVSPDYEVRRWPPRFALSRDGKTVVALADCYANVGRWEVDTGKLIGRFEGYANSSMLGFSTSGEYFTTEHWGIIRVWDSVTTEIISEMQYDNGGYAVALSPNGKYVGIAHADRRITVWDVDTATVKHVLPGAGWNRAITFSADSRLVAAVTFSPVIRVWDVETGEKIAELEERDVSVSYDSLRFSPDGKWFAAANSSTIVIWETQGFTLQHVVRGLGATGGEDSLEFSPNSRWIAGYTGRQEHRIQFWNIETEEVDLELPTGLVLMARFSPDGRWFTTAIWGPERGTYAPGVQIWDTKTGQLASKFSPPYHRIIFSPDGKIVAVGHYDGRIHLVPIEAVLPHLRQDIPIAVKPSELQLDSLEVAKKDALLPNYPNPFNPETWIPYQLAAASSVRIHIYDLMGWRVRTLDLGRQPAGAYFSRHRAAHWDGRNALGERVATGVYFYRLETDDFTATKRMVIVK